MKSPFGYNGSLAFHPQRSDFFFALSPAIASGLAPLCRNLVLLLCTSARYSCGAIVPAELKRPIRVALLAILHPNICPSRHPPKYSDRHCIQPIRANPDIHRPFNRRFQARNRHKLSIEGGRIKNVDHASLTQVRPAAYAVIIGIPLRFILISVGARRSASILFEHLGKIMLIFETDLHSDGIHG